VPGERAARHLDAFEEPPGMAQRYRSLLRLSLIQTVQAHS